MSNEYQGGYTRRQELTCTEAQIATYADIVLHENEKIYVRMNSGVIRMKLGDGVMNLRDLPYTKVFDGDLATVEAWLAAKFDKANIAQELGDSEEKVLSQKAAKVEFDKTNSALNTEKTERAEAITTERNRAIARENDLEELFALPAQEAVNKWLNEHPEATTTVQDESLTKEKFTVELKLHAIKDYVTPQMFGAKGDGETNDKNAIQNAINALKDGGVLFFPESNTPYKVSGNISINGKSHITIMNANLNCNDTESCFNIQNSSDVTFENCVFMGGIQTIRLFTCDTITVNNCTFKECGYCVIQENGYVSNNVFITGNMCLNGKQDFVEANCETNAPSYNWIIDGNIYCHDEIPTESKTEFRFAGFTRVENITITNNIVTNVKGDGAVHLENVGGNVIVDGNTFKNCLGFGYVYTMNSEKNIVISNNIFEHEITDKSTPFVYIYNSQTPVKADINIVGNQFIGNGLVSCPIHYYTDWLNVNLSITDNRFKGITTFFIGSEKSFTFTNNVVECVDFIKQEQDYKGRCMMQANISNNEIVGNITLTFDGNASAFNRDLLFASNKIRGNFVITDSKNTLVSGNFFYNGFTILAGGYYQENVILVNNFISGVGMSDANNYPVIPTAEA